MAGKAEKAAVRRRQVTAEQEKKFLFRKYTFDKVFSALALGLLSPVILGIAVAVFADDPHGSPFYSQIRIGENGRPFRLYKFRTMVIGAENEAELLMPRNEMQGPAFKIRDDARITRAGRFLRETGLDEIPQFVNVLKGDMSVVGPRPPLPQEVEQYTPWQRQRLAVRPGLTCYWQVMPQRNRILFDDWVALDLRYIAERSPAVDRRIMRETVRAMVRRQGE